MAQENTHSSSEFYYVKQTIIPNLDNISDTTKKYQINLLELEHKDSETGEVQSAHLRKIGIQGFPGMKLHFGNEYSNPLIIGNSGVFELDLTDTGGTVSFISLDPPPPGFILPNPIILDFLYQVNEADNNATGG